MQISQEIIDQGLLAELAYLRVEDEFWTNDTDGDGTPDKSYSNYRDLYYFLTTKNKIAISKVRSRYITPLIYTLKE